MKRLIYLVMAVVFLVGMFPIQPAVGQTCQENITVTTNLDSGVGSLRQAIFDVCSGGMITFDASLSGTTITLDSQLRIEKDLTIDGSMLTERVTISGNDSTGVFNIFSGTVTLDSLIITNGRVDEGVA